jgi:hypothetical protein
MTQHSRAFSGRSYWKTGPKGDEPENGDGLKMTIQLPYADDDLNGGYRT